MPRKPGATFVPLEVDFPDNPRVIGAGPMAELLYMRGLCWAKGHQSDGLLDERQLPRIGFGIPDVDQHAAALVEHGLWAQAEGGYQIIGFLERNPSAEELKKVREMKQKAGAAGGKASGRVRRKKALTSETEAESKQNEAGCFTKTKQTRTEQEQEQEQEHLPPDPLSRGYALRAFSRRSGRASRNGRRGSVRARGGRLRRAHHHQRVGHVAELEERVVTFVNFEEVCIRWSSDSALAASVRDQAGVHDVTFTSDGWSCSCSEPYGCSHVLAVKGIGMVAS